MVMALLVNKVFIVQAEDLGLFSRIHVESAATHNYNLNTGEWKQVDFWDFLAVHPSLLCDVQATEITPHNKAR